MFDFFAIYSYTLIMEKFENISEIIKDNLIYYRKKANLTQAELAEKIHYSDKSISKWERGEGVPDIHVFIELAKLYGLTVNDFLTTSKKEKIANIYFSKIMITMMAMISTYALFILAFFILKLTLPTGETNWPFWLLFIYGIPGIFITLEIFGSLYFRRTLLHIIALSCLIWTTALSIFLSLPNVENVYLVFILCVPAEILIILLFTLLHHLKKKRK